MTPLATISWKYAFSLIRPISPETVENKVSPDLENTLNFIRPNVRVIMSTS